MVELQENVQSVSDSKIRLVVKYNIPDSYLDFEYVNKCTDGKTLERILKILRSGEEGYYPQLVQATEERLRLIRPTSKLLRVLTPALSKRDIEGEELNQLTNDLDEWIKVVNQNDKELKLMKSSKSVNEEMPEIRSENEPEKKAKIAQDSNNTKRIASTDYAAWDKYDPDAELIKLDVEETHTKREFQKRGKERDKKTIRFSNFNTEAENVLQATREREKGNEFFKQGDYQEALHYYTNSLSCKSSAAAYTNRAITFIKLKKYDDAMSDCTMALKLEPENVKAHLRMAQSLNALNQFKKALEYVEKVIVLDPNNTIAQDLVNTLSKKCGISIKSMTRLKIEEIESEESELNVSSNLQKSTSLKAKNKNPVLRSALKSYKYYELVPIPGTSKMSPPFFEIVRTNNWEEFRQKKWQILNSTIGPLFTTTIDVSTDEETTTNWVHATTNVSDNETIFCSMVNKKEMFSSVTNINRSVLKKVASNFRESNTKKSLPYDKTSKNNKNDKERNATIIANVPRLVQKTESKSIFENTKETRQKLETVSRDPCSHGEPFVQDTITVIPQPEELNRPFNFFREWMADGQDTTYKRKADILRNINLDMLPKIIGIKLDSKMFSEIVNCLFTHFTVPGEIENLKKVLTNIVRIPRFKIILMFLSDADRKCLNHIVIFLDQHGHSLPSEIRKIYMS